ncbi:MAG: M48 family metalloprotease [Chromatiales bacterium]|jgi:hypothetical protein
MKALAFFPVLLALGLQGCLAPQTQRLKPDAEQLEQEKQKQLELALQHRTSQQQRLADTSFPLLQAASVLCPDQQKAATGLLLTTSDSYSEQFRPVAKRLYGVDDGLHVLHVVPNSPAALASIQPGDVIHTINDKTLSNSKAGISELLELIRQADIAQFDFEIQRNDESLQIRLHSTTICRYPVTLSESDAINAYADGSSISITKGMLRFTNDQELAQIVAHEIAHNVMRHFRDRTINLLGGLLVDVAVATTGAPITGVFGALGASAYMKQYESEADYVGLYIMARAGLEIDHAENFWRRMASEHPEGITGDGLSPTHPTTPSRFLAIRQTIEQIKSKQAAGKKLLPDMQQPIRQ